MNTKGYVRRQEAADLLGISTSTLAEWQRRRMIPYSKMSHRVCLFNLSDLDKAVERFKIKAVGEY